MRFGLLVGGWLDPERREAVARGERPRVDVLELETRLGCRALDFSYLEERCEREPLTRLLRKTIGWSATLAVCALPQLARCDAVYCSGEDVGLALGWLLTRWRKPRLVMRMEQPTYGSSALKKRLWQLYLRGGLSRIDQVLCRTEAHVELLRSQRFSRAEFTPETTDAKFWGTSNSPLLGPGEVLSAGLEERDYPTLIQAVQNLDVNLTIAAGSPWSKFSFQTDAPPENVAVAKFSQKQLRERYACSSVVVLSVNPTARACGMNVVLEAWAMGVPVVATDTEGLRSYLKHGENAYLVPPKDSVALRDALRNLRGDPKLSGKLADNGRQCIESWGNLESYVDRIESALRVRSSASCAKNPASIS